MEKDRFLQALGIVVLATAMVLVYPVLHQRIPFLQQHFETYNWLNGLAVPREAVTADSTDIAPDSTGQMTGPMLLEGAEHLEAFFQALDAKSEQVRIAYFGDSSIEGDLISETLRDSLQRLFGGTGVGYVPITSHVNTFRRTVRHTFSGHWFTCTMGQNNWRKLPRGISGGYFTTWTAPVVVDTTVVTDSSAVAAPVISDSVPPEPVAEQPKGHRVSYGAMRLYPGTNVFERSYLYYGAPKADSTARYRTGSVTTSFGGGEEGQTHLLDGGNKVNRITLSETPGRRVSLNFNVPARVPLYGVSVESPNGVIVDNYATRGNSGSLLTSIDAGVFQEFQNFMDFDLVVLQYGLNVLNPKMKNYNWYQKEISQVIRYLQANLPGVAILVVGPSDKATKIDGVMQTDPSLPLITEALRAAAKENNAAFFSLYEAMGGAGSMIEWVEQKRPSLANLDYTHFNFDGAEEAGHLLLEALLGAYHDRPKRAEARGKQPNNPIQ
ncbi:MAG: hypothetical protein HUU01_00715 [Saprospiraceae bacterium]|nr:hypothetical protein [Saprospiraceae bacterium]